MLKLLVSLAGLLFRSRTGLLAENMALRHQLSVLQRTARRPRLKARDRIFWVWLSRIWPDWRSALVIVKPETVITWHRQGFKLYWRWKSRAGKPGRPRVDPEIRELIRRMSRENPLWGAPRIVDELALLGVHAAKSTVEQYMIRNGKPPSQTWKIFIDNHIKDIAAVDFFTVSTVAFRILYCFVVLRLDRRRVVHFNVTTNPTAPWTAQQLVEAFPYDQTPRFLIRDRDGVYGDAVRSRLHGMNFHEVLTAPRSPWQNGYPERLIGSIRRECLDHVIVLNDAHLIRILTEYFDYYHCSRPHQSLDGNSPEPRETQMPQRGRIVSEPALGGLHHCYRRAA